MKFRAINFWLILSLSFSIFYSYLAWQQAFSSEYVIQDDARQHVFWMMRFIDPNFFPNDLIADYFQSVAPWGYRIFYKSFVSLGINPILLSKFLPSVLGLIATSYCFFIAVQLLPIPITGFLASLLLNQYLWLRDDLSSGTPVAFVYPLFLAFLYYFLKRLLIPCLIAIVFLGLFYPQAIFIAAGTLILQLLFNKNSDRYFCLVGLVTTFIILLLYALQSSEYSPVITAREAQTMPEFLKNGESQFFIDGFFDYWFNGKRSGLVPYFRTKISFIGTALFFLLWLYPSAFPDLKKISRKIILLFQVVLASLSMFFLAHIFLFKLHLPSRYTEHTLRIATAILAGIAFTILLSTLWRYGTKKIKSSYSVKQLLSLFLVSLIFLFIISYPNTIKDFPKASYVVGEFPELYRFFAQQPKDILIASISHEATNLPSFSQKSILVAGTGYTVPYHQGYYRQIRQRISDLIEAQYSPKIEIIQQFIQKHKIDFWLVEKTAFNDKYIIDNRWILQHQPIAGRVRAQLNQNIQPKLIEFLESCSVFNKDNFIVLETQCILRSKDG